MCPIPAPLASLQATIACADQQKKHFQQASVDPDVPVLALKHALERGGKPQVPIGDYWMQKRRE